jgi:hypothetical protein
MGARTRTPTALIAFSLLGCSNGCSDQVDSPPMNSAITNQAGASLPDQLSFTVTCEGPDDELTILGGICGAKTDFLGWSSTDAQSGMGMWVGPTDGPLFMVFNRLDYEPPASKNVAAELQYAAYLVRKGMADDAVATLDQWSDGEPVTSGAVTTYDARFTACVDSWVAEGTFLWRSTTPSFAWRAAQGC